MYTKTEKQFIMNDIDLNKIKENSNNDNLYKIFIYDEEQNKWIFNSSSLYNMINKKGINESSIKTPLILMLDSDENDLIPLCSFLINDSYPNIFDENDDQIYVYGICSNSIFIERKEEKPILLNLHVPKKKFNQSNIMVIVSKIYSFLSFICDIEIVIIKENYYKDQIDFIKVINNMKNSFYQANKRAQEKEKIKDINEKISLNNNSNTKELHLFKSNKTISNEDFNKKEEDENDNYNLEEEEIDDFDFMEQNENEEYNDDFDEDEEFNKDINELFKKSANRLSNKIYTKKKKTMFLINNNNIHSNINYTQLIDQSQLIQNIKKEINQELCKFIYINVYDSDTYMQFAECLYEFAFTDEISLIKDIKQNLTFIDMFRLTTTYIEIKSMDKDWKKFLKEKINQRYESIEKNNKANFSYFTSFKKISNEVNSIAPFFDYEFNEECNLIINDIINSMTKKREGIINEQLKLSSDESFDCLKDLINNEFYLIDDDLKNLLDSHIQFLKREYFSIIKAIYPQNYFNTIYTENIGILNEQIKNDIQQFKSIKNRHQNEVEHESKAVKEIQVDDKKKGTNYVMRETESVREIKVSVLVNKDLKSEIEQDF